MLKQNNKKSKNVNIPIKIFVVYFLTDAHEQKLYEQKGYDREEEKTPPKP